MHNGFTRYIASHVDTIFYFEQVVLLLFSFLTAKDFVLGIFIFIHSFYFYSTSSSPLPHRCTEALPTQRGHCVGVSRRSATGNCEWRTCLSGIRTHDPSDERWWNYQSAATPHNVGILHCTNESRHSESAFIQRLLWPGPWIFQHRLPIWMEVIPFKLPIPRLWNQPLSESESRYACTPSQRHTRYSQHSYWFRQLGQSPASKLFSAKPQNSPEPGMHTWAYLGGTVPQNLRWGMAHTSVPTNILRSSVIGWVWK